MKTCTKCQEVKPLSEFHRKTKSPDGHQPVCKVCAIGFMAEYQRKNKKHVNEKNQAWKLANQARVTKSRAEYKRRWKARMTSEQRKATYRRDHLKVNYNITPSEYDAILSAQGGVCAICGEGPGKKRLAVDHNHETGTNRGLLCIMCNKSLERMESIPDWHTKALNYLAKYLTVRMDMQER